VFNHPDWRIQQSYPPAAPLGSFFFWMSVDRLGRPYNLRRKLPAGELVTFLLDKRDFSRRVRSLWLEALSETTNGDAGETSLKQGSDSRYFRLNHTQ
jgi:hypothetical protein